VNTKIAVYADPEMGLKAELNAMGEQGCFARMVDLLNEKGLIPVDTEFVNLHVIEEEANGAISVGVECDGIKKAVALLDMTGTLLSAMKMQ
jgi:hypothetical protein